MDILIVGAGIGGLAAGHALTRAGHDVTIVDRTPTPSPTGAGIIVPPGAVAALASLGVHVAPCGQRLAGLDIVGASGRRIGRAPGGSASYGVARAELHDALLAGLERHADLRWGATVTALTADPNGVDVDIDARPMRVDLVVGADGIRSTTRDLIGQRRALRAAGMSCWRAIVDVAVAPAARETWLGRERIGVVPIGGGRAYVYLVLDAAAGATGPQIPDGAFTSVAAARALPFAINEVPEQAWIHRDLYELDRAAWGTGRVVLLGDAAHAMTPNLGRGAAAAIHDAIAIADAVASRPDRILSRYRARRRLGVTCVRTASRSVGRIASTWPSIHPGQRHRRPLTRST